MTDKIEDKWADYNAELREILSILQIMQSAVQNLHNPPEMNDIDANLDIIISKFKNLIENNNFIEKKLFS